MGVGEVAVSHILMLACSNTGKLAEAGQSTRREKCPRRASNKRPRGLHSIFRMPKARNCTSVRHNDDGLSKYRATSKLLVLIQGLEIPSGSSRFSMIRSISTRSSIAVTLYSHIHQSSGSSPNNLCANESISEVGLESVRRQRRWQHMCN